MNTSAPWMDSLQKAVRRGLMALYKEPPKTPVEWANEHFYLSSESSYQEGRWETLPFQVAILNAMGNDEIRTVNVLKSARVGYSKMLLVAAAYQIEHKRRNILFLVPSDASAAEFMKSQIETMVRDVPPLRDLAPWYGKANHRDSTLNLKRFSHGKQLWCRGGKAAKNYRELSADTVIYDELAAFDSDVEKEGSPLFLGDKRIEGSTFPKSIRGSTPKIHGPVDEGGCQMETAANASPHLMRLHVPCPHCGAEQALKWGGKDCAFGIKWDGDNPSAAWYVCEANGCVVQQHEMQAQQSKGRWICERTGIWTRDSQDFFDADGETIPVPDSLSFHVWTAYSPFVSWGRIVLDFLQAKKDVNGLKTWTNTTLGETWVEDQGDKIEWELLYGRREVWNHLPSRVVALTGFIDTQDDRYEARIWAWAAGEEGWLVDRWILYGDPASQELKRKVGLRLHQQYQREDGVSMRVALWGWDSGGHHRDDVYAESKKHGLLWVIPTKGHSVYDKPIADFPRKKNKDGVYLTMIGTDNAKELIYSRLKLQPQPGAIVPGVLHLPANDDICDESELKQLTAETKVMKIEKGKRVYRWDDKGRRNEALDCVVGALAMLRVAQQRFGLVLEVPSTAVTAPSPVVTSKRRSTGSGYLKQRR
ncbi:phage terminase large subunit family protein [Pseudomonas aeruginosa]|nr:terminase gpA endonuclease subunit [Pseudomonas aeruginosa]EIU1659224.1 phage terminase large subunit family protein [Pseudomonas aeruginosa]EIW4154250.1 phage terminase large subunit family protein [Pseudomonas aeruginosa]EKW4464939.1 phage terminase large subunit family protein [Pseudomonas aeruginosa]EKX1101476.1 phage terminase large subunit family protein [Pseudomonas aeruginosa]ELK2664572.1 phage terminase large subunit family protein [Pseudomonas aeruginosa]